MAHADGKRASRQSFQKESGAGGFTLIELLVVVAILSATAFAAFGLMSEDRAQVRMDDTHTRLILLRRAILGVEWPAYGGERRLSGFVADNGRLPGSILDLLSKPDAFGKQESVQVPFLKSVERGGVDSNGDGTPDRYTLCLQKEDIPDTDLVTDAFLIKGYRSGGYLNGSTRNGEFRDGWGNVATDDATDDQYFGWNWKDIPVPAVVGDSDFPGFTIASLGADNFSGGDDAAADQTMTLVAGDWQVPLAGLEVKVRSNKAMTADSGNFSAALLVYENGNEKPWRQYRTDTCNIPAGTDSCALRFGNEITCNGETLKDVKIPMGRHLVLLLDARGEITPYDDDPDPDKKKHVFTQAVFFPGVDRPGITLEIRQP
ncbi:MAG: type II secretion system GspH family protein [Zoogloeaceae bacterium]|jgi:prepilin-type N-terminal cleavage/methylation domain-containing protein|nr:type II secretion system GspH family protein [Zoogloeaceae bacterium]